MCVYTQYFINVWNLSFYSSCVTTIQCLHERKRPWRHTSTKHEEWAGVIPYTPSCLSQLSLLFSTVENSATGMHSSLASYFLSIEKTLLSWYCTSCALGPAAFYTKAYSFCRDYKVNPSRVSQKWGDSTHKKTNYI